MKRPFTLGQAQAMAPLVHNVLAEIARRSQEAKMLRRRVELLRECRRSSEFAVRRQYYLANDALGATERHIEDAKIELADLGVVLLDASHGVAGFPFKCAKAGTTRRRSAYFLLKSRDGAPPKIHSWRLKTSTKEHRIPAHWQTDEPVVCSSDGPNATPES